MPPLDDVSYGALLVALGSADALRTEDWSGLRTAAKAEDRPFMAPLDDLSYGAVMVGIASADAPPSSEDWVAARADLEAATETTGALPTHPDRHFPVSAAPARDVPVLADAAEESAAEPFYSEALAMLGLADVEPLPLQAISSFDLTLTADPMPMAPAWDAI
jgi:hypothetical protein